MLHKPHTKCVTDHTQCLADFTNGNNPVLVCGTFSSTYGTKLVGRTHISGCNVGFNNPERLICSDLCNSKTINQPINFALPRNKQYRFLHVTYAWSSGPVWFYFHLHFFRFSHTLLRVAQKRHSFSPIIIYKSEVINKNTHRTYGNVLYPWHVSIVKP